MKDDHPFPVLPGLRKTVLQEKTCGDCGFYQSDPQNLNRGYCHGNPPLPILLQTNNGPAPAAIRPPVLITDIACRHYLTKK